jgi:AraC-like DNA-binding protein
MVQETFFSGDLPAGERLAAAEEMFGRGVLPMRLVDQADRPFEASVRHVDLAPLKVVELAATPATVLRTPPLIRRGDPEMLSVILALEGGLAVSQSGRDTVVGKDEFALYDSSRPFRIRVSAPGGRSVVVSAHAPRAALPLPPAGLDRLLARPLPAGEGSGFGALLAQLLGSVSGGAGPYRPADLARLGGIAHDLMTAVVAHHLDAEAAVPDDTHHRALLLRVDAFVRRQLHDTSLSPSTIASAHHISVGHLHRLFRSRGVTVAGWIRRQRLEGARRDLVDPALRDTPVHRIAARWGFKDHSSFTRAFRAAFGTAPTDYRHDAGRPPGRA